MEMNPIMIAIAKRKKPTQEQVTSAVNSWLDDHPEVVVEDGSITEAKLSSDLAAKIHSAIVDNSKLIIDN